MFSKGELIAILLIVIFMVLGQYGAQHGNHTIVYVAGAFWVAGVVVFLVEAIRR